ncbi:MAG TPA: ABC transporter permease [Candidatus Acidoferrales bacterium]|nr:ABC transporter permease [Candidatus Acidoferrales bacterium]
MKLTAYFRSIAAKFLHRSHVENDMEDELRSHIENRADDLERSGLPRAEAERRARIEFGGYQKYKEEIRESLGAHFIETLVQDLRFSLRMLRKSPSFTFAAVFTLALGIGANAVVFAVLNAMILRPLNVPEPESLYGIERTSDKLGNESYPNYLDFRDRNHSFDDLAAFDIDQAGFDTGDNPDRVWFYEVTGNYFDVLRLHPYLGRFFHASDEHGPNSAPYVVLNYAFWHTHFHDDPGVAGRIVQLNKHPFTIIGVAPLGFHGTLLFGSPDFFVPLVNQEQIAGSNFLNARGNNWIWETIGHLRPGVTPAQAAADLNTIGAYLQKTYPKDEGKMTFALARPTLYGDYAGGPIRAFLTALMVLALLVLLAACANLGSLFAARAADRSREVALRLALGAGPVRVLRQLFTEAMVISVMGGALGLWGSVVLLRFLSAWHPLPRYPVYVAVNPDAHVYGMALLLSLVSGLLFGAVPVRQILRMNRYGVIKSGSLAMVGRGVSVRDFLLTAQIALCAVLVTSSFVAVRGLVRSAHGNFGFTPQNVILVDTDLNTAGYHRDQQPSMQKRMLDAMKALPGVSSVALADSPPLASGSTTDSNVFTDKTTDLRASNAATDATVMCISPEYFQAAGTALLAGREFTWKDDKTAPRVAVVNQLFARKLFGSVIKAMGQYFKLRDGARIQVVGVAEDGKYGGLTEDPQPAMFLPILQSPSSETMLVLRSRGNSEQLAAAVRSKLRDIDSGLPSYIETWDKALEDPLFGPRMATASLGVLGIMGALLSVTGIFGMAAYSVSRRKRELGIRIALGAQRKELLQAALGRAVKLLAFGSVAGLLLGILASRVLASIVYEATPRDPLVLAGVVLAMVLVGLVATWIPAQRALSINPVELLREE